jgi:DNA polymerase-3 subunit epsilon
MLRKYAIVDVETTGGDFKRDRIIEIAIVIHNGKEILDRFESLINPERSIPYNISRLTGIVQEMVVDAPYFYEVAKEIVLKTEDCIFVAHNVRFDYNFVRYEFERLGYTFSKKRLCTVKLARRTLGLKSCSMDSLSQYFDIQVENRHRAMGDAAALAEMFPTLLGNDESKIVKQQLNEDLRANQIPPSMSLSFFLDLPEDPGVYYMKDRSGNILYIGKSNNIKKRIAQHFQGKEEKSLRMYSSVARIDLKLTGSPFLAELVEAGEIKKYLPPLNRAQRSGRIEQYFSYLNKNEDGLLRLSVSSIEKIEHKEGLLFYHKHKKGAKSFLRGQLYNLELCECLQNEGKHRPNSCISAQTGACLLRDQVLEEYTIEQYNDKFEHFQQRIEKYPIEHGVILVDSLKYGEQDFVLIENNTYMGYGTLELEETQINSIKDFNDYLIPQQETRDTVGIIKKYLRKKKRAIRVLNAQNEEIIYA